MMRTAVLLVALCSSGRAEKVCPPLSTPFAAQELFAFDPPSGLEGWKQILQLDPAPTTIASFEVITAEMVCAAHAVGVRVVHCIDFGGDLTNATVRTKWVEDQVSAIAATGIDGFNVDVEGNSAHRNELTELIAELRNKTRAANPHSQLSFDLAWTPQGREGGYDYPALAKLLDFIVPMDYDEVQGLHASANSPMGNLVSGIAGYKAVGIDASQLVIGLPWYGYDFPCKTTTKWADCMWPAWSEVHQVGYMSANETALQSGSRTDAATVTVYTDYMVNGTRHQTWFDNPTTLAAKYEKARLLGARGIAMWTAGEVNYSKPQGQDMWRAMSSFFRKSLAEETHIHI